MIRGCATGGCRSAGPAGSRSTATLRVVGEERIFAIGDGSVIVDNPLPQLAQPALQMGKFAAEQIARLHRGLETETFHYRDKGTMATIGRGDAVLQMPIGLKLKGVIAWIGWIVLHLVYPARRAQPGPDVDQPRVPVRRPAPLQRDRRRRDGDAEAAGDECQGRTAGRCIASAPEPFAAGLGRRCRGRSAL